MRLLIIPAFFILIIAGYGCKSQPERIGYVERSDAALDDIIDEHAEVKIIADGFEWTEGPLWLEKENMLLFCDIPANTIYKWTESKGKEVYLTPSGYTSNVKRGGEIGSNGLLLDNQGRLILCQHGDRRIARMNAPLSSPKPDFITLADRYNGKRFDSPNDAVISSNGDIYFTDPPYGLEKNAEDKNKEAPYQGVYKLSADGKLTLLIDSITRPNGIAFLPGEKQLIIANSDAARPYWYIYDVSANDSLTNGRIFYNASEAGAQQPGLPDGLKVDSQGIVYATGPGGVWIFDKSGKLLGRIRVNSLTSNCAISPDKTLYITADMYVLRVPLGKVKREK
jgi:gluconolactonase